MWSLNQCFFRGGAIFDERIEGGHKTEELEKRGGKIMRIEEVEKGGEGSEEEMWKKA